MKAPERVGPRREVKFLVTPDQSREVMQWALSFMGADSHCADAADPAYRVESCYLDTPGYDCFHREGATSWPKYRFRRYDGRDATTFLEEKLRRGDLVWKRRIASTAADLASFLDGEVEVGANGDVARAWFASRLRVLQLRPIAVISYRRWALVSAEGERLTVDRDVAIARLPKGTDLFAGEEPARLEKRDILELKYTGDESPLMRELRERLAARARSFSKYRTGVRALGMETIGRTRP